MARILEAYYESNDFSEFTAIQGAPSVVTTLPHHGVYHQTAIGSAQYAYKTVNNATVYSRAYFAFDALNAVNGETLTLMALRNQGDGRDIANIRIYRTGGVNKWQMFYQNNGNYFVASDLYTNPAINTYYCVELYATCSTDSAAYRVWINGNELTDIAQTGKNSVSTAITRIGVGSYYEDLATNINVYTDCVVADDTNYVGLETNKLFNCDGLTMINIYR